MLLYTCRIMNLKRGGICIHKHKVCPDPDPWLRKPLLVYKKISLLVQNDNANFCKKGKDLRSEKTRTEGR